MSHNPSEVHKTQALSIKHVVRGCLEGVFAMGQVYVLISRVVDPRHLELIGRMLSVSKLALARHI